MGHWQPKRKGNHKRWPGCVSDCTSAQLMQAMAHLPATVSIGHILSGTHLNAFHCV